MSGSRNLRRFLHERAWSSASLQSAEIRHILVVRPLLHKPNTCTTVAGCTKKSQGFVRFARFDHLTRLAPSRSCLQCKSASSAFLCQPHFPARCEAAGAPKPFSSERYGGAHYAQRGGQVAVMGNAFRFPDCCKETTTKMAFTELKWILEGQTKRVNLHPQVLLALARWILIHPTARQTNRRAVRPPDRRTDRPAVRPLDRPTGRPTDRPDRPTVRPHDVRPSARLAVCTVRPTARPSVRPTHRPHDRLSGRPLLSEWWDTHVSPQRLAWNLFLRPTPCDNFVVPSALAHR